MTAWSRKDKRPETTSLSPVHDYRPVRCFHLNDFMCPRRKTWKTCLCLRLPEAGSKGRDAAIQPHVLHWVLALGNLRTGELKNWRTQNHNGRSRAARTTGPTNECNCFSPNLQSSLHRSRKKRNDKKKTEQSPVNSSETLCASVSSVDLQVFLSLFSGG